MAGGPVANNPGGRRQRGDHPTPASTGDDAWQCCRRCGAQGLGAPSIIAIGEMVKLRAALTPFAIAARPVMGQIPPGLMIAAPRSGSGKTTLTLGLLRAFRRAGVAVAQRQMRPRLYRSSISSRSERAPQRQSELLGDAARASGILAAQVGLGCDLIVCEALMGLFDGVPGPAGRTGSSADVAAALGWPVLLVLDASGQSQSAAAVVKGCATYDPRITIAGVVLNRIGSPRHAKLATDVIEALGIPVVGSLPRSATITLPERHLGLVQAKETNELDERLERIAAFVAEHTRIDAIRALASPGHRTTNGIPRGAAVQPPGQRIAVARDASVLVPLSPPAARMARRRCRDSLLLPARRRGTGRRLRRLLAAGRLSRTARRQARRIEPLHGRPTPVRRDRARSMASAADTWRSEPR